ncbi:MAG: hypothetical protein COB56_03575 [Robiginitomaculum sp.]|nr:MAG: hypothetical protein COB56_03575 [Robiginitomaculum sp.]
MDKLRNWFESIIPDAQAVFRRFPLAAVLVAAFTLVILTETSFGGLSNEMMMRLVGGIILAAYVSVILTLYGEGRGKTVSIAIKTVVILSCLLAGYFFRQMAFITPAAIAASILFLGNAPFWRAKRDDVAVWDFTHKLWTAVLFTTAGSMIYVMGIFAIMGALKSLFGVNMSKVVEDWMLPIGLGFLAPMAWMSMLPRHDEEDGDSLRNPGFISRAVGFLGAWILAPLTLIYAAILLAYGLKILLTQSVPNGQIAELVTPFLIIGTLTWLILDPPFIQKKRLARWYAKLWFPLTIPAALLLAYAVLVRISQYGWTVERYLLVLASVWALGIAVWFTFRSEAKRDIRIIPGFAALLLALASIGPWGADGVSASSQASRLKAALVANQMLDTDGYLNIVEGFKVPDNEQAIKAKGALAYLISNRKIGHIRKFISPNEAPDKLDKQLSRNSLKSFEIYKWFGLDKTKTQSQLGIQREYEYDERKPIAVTGYDYISSPQHFSKSSEDATFMTSYWFGDIKVSSHNQGIIIDKRWGKELGRFQIWDWLKEHNINGPEIIMEPLVTVYEQDGLKISLFITQASYSDDPYYTSIDYIILIKGVEID